MPGPSRPQRPPTRHPFAPTPLPDEGMNPRLEDPTPPPDQSTDQDHVESEEEQQARESEKAFDQAITRLPPG